MHWLWKTGRVRRWRLTALVAAVAGLSVYLAAGDWSLLRLQYNLQSRLARYAKVADLKVAEAPGLKMFLHPDDPVITRSIMASGLWEPNETKWIARLLREGDTFVDIGANVGYYTLVAARLVGPTGRVFAFEPDPIAFSIMEKNVRLNGFQNVTLEQKAVSNENGTIQLFLSEENKGDHRIYQTEEGRLAIDVGAVTLDDYFEDDPGRIDLVKIDTQGAEGLILEGMRAILDRNDDIMMAVEFWPYGLQGSGYDASDLIELLRSRDFLFFDLGVGTHPIRKVQDVEGKHLLQTLTIENRRFTDLLLVRGYAEMNRLRSDSLQKAKALEVDTAALRRARRQWEESLRAAVEDGAPAAAALPAAAVAALTTPTEQRSGRQSQLLETHFRSVTPLLAEARRDLKQARTAVENFRAQVLTRKQSLP